MALVYDKNSVANARFGEFNPMWAPTSYWDGGEYVLPGTNYATFYNYLDSAGSRVVPDLVADLEVDWLGNAKMEISYTVENNEGSNYPGRMRIYIIELESTLWNDYNGNTYYHAFLDFAVNQVIDIPAVDSISDTITWDGVAEGYPGITADNVQVILSVFDDEGHTSYSDPPSGNPFTAYYADETVAALPEGGENNPPETPEIDGPTSGNMGTEYDYTISTTDPDGDDVFYWIEWCNEGCTSGWQGPYTSGEERVFSHTWDEQGDFTIKVKAKDTYDAESDYGTLDVTMPRTRAIQRPFFNFLQNHPILYQLLQRLLNL